MSLIKKLNIKLVIEVIKIFAVKAIKSAGVVFLRYSGVAAAIFFIFVILPNLIFSIIMGIILYAFLAEEFPEKKDSELITEFIEKKEQFYEIASTISRVERGNYSLRIRVEEGQQAIDWYSGKYPANDEVCDKLEDWMHRNEYELLEINTCDTPGKVAIYPFCHGFLDHSYDKSFSNFLPSFSKVITGDMNASCENKVEK